MKKLIIILSVVVFVGGFLAFYNPKPVSSPTQNDSDISNTSQKWESKVDEQASVTVTITPSNLLFDSKEWTFDVVLNTHSVELDQDMTKIIVLVDDSNNEYKPLRWEGTEAGGHHRKGVLIFAPITPYPQHLNLIIKDIGNVKRSFAWILAKE